MIWNPFWAGRRVLVDDSKIELLSLGGTVSLSGLLLDISTGGNTVISTGVATERASNNGFDGVALSVTVIGTLSISFVAGVDACGVVVIK